VRTWDRAPGLLPVRRVPLVLLVPLVPLGLVLVPLVLLVLSGPDAGRGSAEALGPSSVVIASDLPSP
jgi:hypothetical protein